MALITEASMAFKEAKAKGEDIKLTVARVVPDLMARYPTTVMKHGKKLLKTFKDGGIEGLEDFL